MSAKPEEKPDGAPEWIVSFADMITIMMSFFVIMFAIASGEAAKGKRNRQQQAAFESLQNRFGDTYKPFAGWGLMSGNSLVKNVGSRLKSKSHSTQTSDDAGDAKVLNKERARIRVPGRGDHVVIGGIVFFDDRSPTLTDLQQARLKIIAEEIAGKPQAVEIVGHASGVPCRPAPPITTAGTWPTPAAARWSSSSLR